jgi:hypothetical protein
MTNLGSFEWLKDQLESIERRVNLPASMDFAGVEEVRGGPTHSNAIQTVVMDSRTSLVNRPVPIIIAVGSNYTQDPVEVPRTSESPFAVVDTTGSCRANCLRGIEHFNANRDCWVAARMAASANVIVPPVSSPVDFHFVMTNLCLWITKMSWTDIKCDARKWLLQNNPTFDGKPNPASAALHLIQLARLTSTCNVLWVFHGIGDDLLFPYFQSFARQNSIDNWLAMPNLSRGQDYERLKEIKSYRERERR